MERPKSALIVLVIVASCLVAHVSIHEKIDMAAQQRLTAARLSNESPEGKISDHDVNQKAQQAINMRRIGGYVGYILGIPLVVCLLALVLWLLFGGWSEGIGFKRCYAFAAIVALPFGIRQLVSVPVILSYSSIDPEHTWGLFKTSLGALMPSIHIPGLYVVDPFWLWAGVLAGLAGRAMGRGRVWSTLVGIVVWLLLAFAGRNL